MTTVAVDEVTARAWYEFVRERLEDELRDAYPLPDESPIDAYQAERRGAQEEHLQLVDALARGDNDAAEDHFWGLRNRASKWKAHAEYPVPISDGTMPCPVPAPETGHPCTKRIPQGWAAYEGHGGGHFWQSSGAAELQARGAHYDPACLVSGMQTEWHLPEDCTPSCWRWRDR